MKANLIEMEGFLRGKCLPGDMLVNETNTQYLVRKFAEAEAKCAALAAENAALKKAVTGFNELYGQGLSVANWHLNGDLEPLDNFFGENDWNPETPSTDAFLAEVRAQGVEMAIKELFSANTIEASSIKSLLQSFSAQLRQGAAQ